MITLLRDKITLLEESIKLEKDKRQAILSTDGHKLHAISKESEKKIEELRQLDEALALACCSLLAYQGDQQKSYHFQAILEAMQQKDHKQVKILELTIAHYHERIIQLKEMVQANQNLLNSTSQRIVSLLGELQKQEIDASQVPIYSPKASHLLDQPRTAATLMSADA